MKIKLGGILLIGLLTLLSGCVTDKAENKIDVKIARDYMENVSVDGLSGFVVLDDASQIPYQAGDFKNPAKYKKVIQPPAVVRLNNESKVTLYAWTSKGGLLSKWDITLKNEKVSFVRGESVDVDVGHFIPIGFEQYLPAPGVVFENGSVNAGR